MCLVLTLYHSYTTIRNICHSIRQLHFGKSDHLTVVLIPVVELQWKTTEAGKVFAQCWSEVIESNFTTA